jgi:hypothetical protein
MSRSGYSDDYDDDGKMGLYRGAVERAIRGKRGQRLLREMGTALDTMAVKELAANVIVEEGQVCALGSVAVARGMKLDNLDIEDPDDVAKAFGIARALAAEIAYENDEGAYRSETPAERWKRMREWVNDQLLPDELTPAKSA